jgi:GT2 family glycosyltransferase
MPFETAARVCVVVISYNSSATLGRCLDALKAQTFRDFCLVLIDNASADPPRPPAAGLPFPVQIMEMQENLGFAQAMNVGLAATGCPLIAALNPDAFPEPAWLAELVAAADAHPEVAAFGSRQIDAADPRRLDGYGDHYLLWGFAWRGRVLPLPAAAIDYCFGVCAAAALYRAEALRTVGGFDGRLFCFYEDVDVAFRLRLGGYHCAVVRAAAVAHVGGASFKDRSDFADFLIARNQWCVLVKDMPAALLPLAVLGFFAIHLLSAARRPRIARLRGLGAGLRRTGEFLAARDTVARTVSLGALLRWLTVDPRAFLRKDSPRQLRP